MIKEGEKVEPLERCAIALERIAYCLEALMIGGQPQDDGPELIEVPDCWQRMTSFSTEPGYEVFLKPDGETIKLHRSEIA